MFESEATLVERI